jgi:hypothetical protein
MQFVFIALESNNVENIYYDLVTIGNVDPNNLVVCLAKPKANFFKEFHMLAELYIFVEKYWYGTFYKKLTYVRIKNAKEIPLLFSVKYLDEIRLGILAECATIVAKPLMSELDTAYQLSRSKFNNERVVAIKPLLTALEKRWTLLVSNKNPI